MALSWKRRRGLVALFTISVLSVVMVEASGAQEPSQIIRFPFQIDHTTILNDGQSLLLVSNSAQRIVLYDLQDEQERAHLELGSRFFDLHITDVAADPGGRFVYLVGTTNPQSKGGGVLVQLNISTREMRSIQFADRFVHPTVAASRQRQIFLGDLGSNTLTIVDSKLFEKALELDTRRSSFKENAFLKSGPVNRVAASADGRFAIVAHDQINRMSLIEVRTSEVVDEIGPGVAGAVSLAMAVSDGRQSDEKSARATSLVIADLTADVLVVIDIESDFRKFTGVTQSSLRLAGNLPKEPDLKRAKGDSPVLVAVDSTQSKIFVGSRWNNYLAVFARKGKFLERLQVVSLKNQPVKIAVAADGGRAVIVNADRRSVLHIRSIDRWLMQESSVSTISSGLSLIREAQKALLTLRYPVGVADGLAGPSTVKAVTLFQNIEGLRPTGEVNNETLKRLLSVSAEPNAEMIEASFDARVNVNQDEAPGRAGCKVFSAEARCNNLKRVVSSLTKTGLVEEDFCPAANTGERLIQVDSYKYEGKVRSYLCTRFNSCSALPFRSALAFERLCSR